MPSKEDFDAFLKALADDPELISKQNRREEQQAFIQKYNLQRATPLKCPSCSTAQFSGGSLWIDKDNPNRFVCRKCKTVWIIDLEDADLGKFIEDLRWALKQ